MKRRCVSVLLWCLACSASSPSLKPSESVSEPARSCEPFARPGAADAGVAPPCIGVEAVERGLLRWDWSRLTLGSLGAKTSCVRIVQQNGNDLGYDDSDDVPSRRSLQFDAEPRGVSFLVDESTGGKSDAPQALGAALGKLDLRLELFQRRCADLCNSSRPATTIHISPGQSSPQVSSVAEDVRDCHIVGKRTPPRSDSTHDGEGGSARAASDAGVRDGG